MRGCQRGEIFLQGAEEVWHSYRMGNPCEERGDRNLCLILLDMEGHRRGLSL